MAREVSPRSARVLAVVGVVVVTAYAATAAWAASGAPYDVWAALVVLPGVLFLNIALVVRVGRLDPDPRFARLLMWAFAFKCLATIGRFLMTFVLYDASDAGVYHREGGRLAQEYRDGNFGADLGRDVIGTGFVRLFTGLLYTVTGSSIYIAYAVFSLLAFWGLYFLYRGFRVGVPTGNPRRYAFLVLFLPSMLFWPSSLGKEALMTLAIGLFAYGAALLLSGYRTWLVPLVLGVAFTAVVRPHVTAALFAGLAVAFLLRRRPGPSTELTPLAYAGSAALMVVAGAFVAQGAASFAGVDDLSIGSVDAAVTDSAERTNGGGSSFDATGVNGPLDLPMAFVSIMFRPFIFEADNAQMLLAALEGTFLLVLAALSWRSLVELRTRVRRQPYLILCLVYILIFVYVFSSFSNFGILTRQRVQVLPFLLVLLALRTPHASPEPSQSATAREQERALS